jgi:eukaryotic-like serine/threonine-protein kinase
MDVVVKEGDILGGAYRVERIIGCGGMAVVVAAIDARGTERVAIKVLHRKAARSRDILARFEREQWAIQQMRSEHVTRMLGAGIFKDCPYMVMELLRGQDLAEWLKTRDPLEVPEAVEYMLQACAAIAEAHAHQIIHRDLKPGNLFLTHRRDGTPCIKVLDFGIAKASNPNPFGSEEESALTRTTDVFGSPFYMSPEQMISSHNVGPATDIWSLGVILFELLTKTLPFGDRSAEKLIQRVLHGEPTPLRWVKPEYPEALEAIILHSLERDPDKRCTNVTDFAIGLSQFAPARALSSVAHAFAMMPPHEASIASVPRVSHEALAAHDSIDPEEPENPTLYNSAKNSRVSIRLLRAVAAGFGVFACGLAAGLVLRRPPPAADSHAAASSIVSPTSSASDLASVPPFVADIALASAPNGSANLALAASEPEPPAPIEMDLDESLPSSRPVARRRRLRDDAGVDAGGEPAGADADTQTLAESASSRPIAPAESSPAPALSTAATLDRQVGRQRPSNNVAVPSGSPSSRSSPDHKAATAAE